MSVLLVIVSHVYNYIPIICVKVVQNLQDSDINLLFYLVNKKNGFFKIIIIYVAH